MPAAGSENKATRSWVFRIVLGVLQCVKELEAQNSPTRSWMKLMVLLGVKRKGRAHMVVPEGGIDRSSESNVLVEHRIDCRLDTAPLSSSLSGPYGYA